MRRALWVVLFWTTLATAQVVGPGFVDYVTSAPSGACSQGAHQQNILGSGQVWTCQSGTWGQVSGGAGGTVTSVSFTGGLISVANPTTTPALTVAGTSGGIPYFSGAATWASSGALTVNVLTKGGGAGSAPTNSLLTDNGTTLTYSGTGGVSTTGTNGGLTLTIGDCSGLAAGASVDLLCAQTGVGLALNNAGAGYIKVVGISTTDTLTNKTLTTPTIASFTNATHNHQNAVGGGTLTGAALTPCTSGFFLPTYPTIASASVAAAGVQNQVEGWRFAAPCTLTVAHIVVQQSASFGVGTHVGFDFHSSDGTTQIGTTGALDGTVTGVRNLTITAALVQGVSYIFTWTTDSATPASGTFITPSGFTRASLANFANANTPVDSLKGATASSGGVPPTGSMGALSASSAGTNMPLVYVSPN